MNLTPKNYPTKFEQFIFNEIDPNLYKYKFLSLYIDKALKGQKPIYNSSVLNTKDKSWILILHGEMLAIYGYKWSIDQFKEISEIFDLNTFTNYTLAGETELIDELIKFYNPKNFKIEKRRLFYRTTKIIDFHNSELEIKLGSIHDLGELAVMLQDYYHEEYNGLNEKKIEEMEQKILSLIQTEKIYILIDKTGVLLSFCTIIDPDIGIIFTKKEHRNKGNGKVVLSYCSNHLFRKNGIVYLMTDGDKVESNVLCEKVGFIPYFNYSMTKINCG